MAKKVVELTFDGNTFVVVPTAKIGALVEILSECGFAERRWENGYQNSHKVVYKKEADFKMVDPGDYITEEQFKSLNEAIEAEKAAAAAAAAAEAAAAAAAEAAAEVAAIGGVVVSEVAIPGPFDEDVV